MFPYKHSKSEVIVIKRTISAMSGDGVIAHNRRTYTAENVDPTRTHLNIEYCYTPIEQAYHELFDESLAEFNAKQKRKDRCIENYYEKIRDGKQEKTFYEVIFQVGNREDMSAEGENAELAKAVLDKFMRSFQKRNPQLHVLRTSPYGRSHTSSEHRLHSLYHRKQARSIYPCIAETGSCRSRYYRRGSFIDRA